MLLIVSFQLWHSYVYSTFFNLLGTGSITNNNGQKENSKIKNKCVLSTSHLHLALNKIFPILNLNPLMLWPEWFSQLLHELCQRLDTNSVCLSALCNTNKTRKEKEEMHWKMQVAISLYHHSFYMCYIYGLNSWEKK